MTKEELKIGVQEKYKNLTQKDWLDKIKYRGLEHKFDKQLKELKDFYPEKINRMINAQFSPDPEATAKENEAQRLEFEQYKSEKIERLKDKFAAVIKEIEFRKAKIVKRKPIGTIYYLDINAQTGTLTGTCTFTNASTTLSGSGTAFTTELAVGNYVRVSTGTEWYKVTAITDDVTATISPAFKQTTVTDTAGATKKNANDGLATTTAWSHLNQYTTDTVRSAGDILKIRANQTHLYAGVDIIFDEDGTVASYIELR